MAAINGHRTMTQYLLIPVLKQFKEGTKEYMVQEQIAIIKEQYFYLFGNSNFSSENLQGILSYNNTDSTLKISADILKEVCEHNIKYQQQSIPALVDKIYDDQQKIEKLYGNEINQLNYYAEKTLQRVTEL